MLDERGTFGITESFSALEEKFSINFSEAKTGFCLSLHYNGDNSYFFDNGKRQIVKMSNKFDSEKCQVTKNIFKRKCVYFFSRL